MKLLTIFTPTYNRAHTLPKLYKSLCEQSSQEFQWLIVDDGSFDNTKEIIKKWINEKKVTIIYLFRENGGKMRAHNLGVQNTNTELFLCVDSDDYLTNDAVSKLIITWRKFNGPNISGVISYKKILNKDNNLMSEFPNNLTYTTLRDLYHNGFKGDTTLMYKTNILKEYLFPEIEGEKFITENYIYSQIDNKYNLVILAEYTTICEYLIDGYSQNYLKIYKENPKGWALYFNQQIKYQSNIINKIKTTSKYICFSLISKNKKIISSSSSVAFTILCLPLGFLLKLKIKKKFNK